MNRTRKTIRSANGAQQRKNPDYEKQATFFREDRQLKKKMGEKREEAGVRGRYEAKGKI